jgi:protein O-GlcNAc transferase
MSEIPTNPARAGYAAAHKLREAGRLAEAEQALAGDDGLEALALMAHLRLLQGDKAGAAAVLARLMALDPASAPALRTAARVEMAHGRAEAAVTAARAAVAVAADNHEDLLVLATVLARATAQVEAQAIADRVLALDPERAEAYLVRAQVAQARGDAAGAVEACQALLRLRPHLPLWSSLGDLLLGLGRDEAAAAALRTALERRPDDVQALVSLGTALQRLGRLGEAREAFQRAIGLDPGAGLAHLNLGRLLTEEGRYVEAEAACRQALALRPDLAMAAYALAGVLRATGRLREAEAAYRQALALQPQFVEAELGLGEVLLGLLRVEAARAVFDAVAARNVSLEAALLARINLAALAGSAQEIAAERARFAAGIDEALKRPGVLTEGARAVSSSWFYLAYHGLDDRPLMTALDQMFTAKAPDLSHQALHLAARPPRGDRPIRVGFVSQFLRNHTIGRLYQGFIEGLDRSRFEVVVAHLPKTVRDPMREAIGAAADQVVDLSPGLAQQRAQLAAADLDVLIYTDVGMSPASYALARSRLAPVQAVGWGHPDTTGLTSLDYFISADGIEPDGAEAHYAERLVRLARLPAFYPVPQAPARRSRAELGLPATGRLYGCPQSLFKMHPDFDAVLAGIVRRDPQAWLVFLEGPQPEWGEALRQRWRAACPEVAERAVFLGRVAPEAFLGLLAELDVLLDPPHFGSGNTLYEAMAVGTPVVTWPGAFARGRIVAAAYRQMGAGEELIVQRLEDYAERAVAVAGDAGARAALRTTLPEAARAALFDDQAALRGLEAFLEAAVVAAERGEQLPAGWREAGE